MRHDDGIPVARSDLGRQALASFLGGIFLAGDEELGVGVDLLEFPRELFQDVVGNCDQALVPQTRLLHFHRSRGHYS